MNDNVESRGRSSVGWTLLGFALGATAGAGIALLMAPTSGESSRARIGATARGWRESAVGTLEDARAAVADLGTDARSALLAGQESFARRRDARGRRSEVVLAWNAEVAARAQTGEHAKDEAGL